MPTVAEIIRKIKKETNCYFLRDGANHEIWYNPNTKRKFQIPRHQSKEVASGTVNKIYKDAGLR